MKHQSSALNPVEPLRVESVGGTRVLFQRNTSPIVNIQIFTDIGSADEPQNWFGVAHFLEHMFFKGTPSRSAKQVNRDADLMGAKLNAWTWFDQTNYHISVMAENFEPGFALLADIYLNATFPEDELEKERTVILSEMRRYEDDPPSYLGDRAVEHFCENGLAHKVIGTEDSVQGLQRQDLIDFRRRFYGGENTLISIAGGLPWETVRSVIENHFKNPVCEPVQSLAPGIYRPGYLQLIKNEIQESQYLLLYPALPYQHPSAYSQSVMASVLGGNASALLFERIREELGLCYGIYSRVYRFEGFNYLEVSTGCAQKDLETIHREVLGIIDQLQNDLVSEERLQMVKASLLSSLYMGVESSAGINTLLAQCYLRGDRGDILRRRVDEIKSVTREGVREQAREIFSKPPLRAELTPAS